MAFEFFKKIFGTGYVKYIGHMGTDENFVEAARMSTGKGFYGWYWDEDTYSDCICADCNTHHLYETLLKDESGLALCTNCWKDHIAQFSEDTEWKEVGCPAPKLLGRKGSKRDLSLLETLYSNRHQTPFEMGELCIEVKAPIFVFREWHRHRTQSYNEFSARYSQMPNEHYVPETNRIQKQSKTNKQGSAEALEHPEAQAVVKSLGVEQQGIYKQYEILLDMGIAKEIARVNTPVSRMSKMRAKTDIRNWLAFLLLRMDKAAQYEIRMYANAVASLIKQLFPKTFDLFLEYDLLGNRFSRSEMRFLNYLFNTVLGDDDSKKMLLDRAHTFGMPTKSMEGLLKKLTVNKEDEYKDVLEKL